MAARVQYRNNQQPARQPARAQAGYAPAPRGNTVSGQAPVPRRSQGSRTQQSIDVKLYRIEQYQSMWNHWSGVRDARIQKDYDDLMASPKGHQLQANLQKYWEQKVRANGGKEVSLTREDFFEWVGRYEMDRPSRNAAGGYDSSDDEDGYDSGDWTDAEETRGCCG